MKIAEGQFHSVVIILSLTILVGIVTYMNRANYVFCRGLSKIGHGKGLHLIYVLKIIFTCNSMIIPS